MILSEKRARVVAYMKAMSQVEWTPAHHMDFTDCLLAARTAIYNDDVVSFGKPIIQGMIDYRRQRQTAADARSRSTDSTIDKLRHRPRS